MKTIDHSTDELLEALLVKAADEFSEAIARGERPDIDDYVRRFPAIADSIRRLFPVLSVLDRTSSPDGLPATFTPEGTVGGFKVFDEIGRGGMGIVYRAEETSLGREVALKILPKTVVLDEKQLARFRNEARAAGNLNHPHIVPVYSFGVDQGVHYFAMRLVRGRSLAELIHELRCLPGIGDGSMVPTESSLARQLATSDIGESDSMTIESIPNANGVIGVAESPSSDVVVDTQSAEQSGHVELSPAFFRNVARLGIQAARALHHAHAHGVLHRDIKPANLLVEGRGHLWIADFGLARFSDDVPVTTSGDLLGTVRYMSPEQTTGRRAIVDHRSDVYSLGITLYEWLTLQPAYQAADRLELLRQIATIDPVPPRKLNAAIPRELNTIILKATEKSAADRYATASDLADDLQRFLDLQPIKARPASWFGRTTKWCQRHQAIVWSGVAAMLVALTVLAASTVLIARAYQTATDQRLRAEANLGAARELIDRTYAQEFSAPSDAAGMTPARRELLLQLVRFYERLPKEELHNESLRHDACKVRLRLGDIYWALGEFGQAIDAYSKSIETATGLGGAGSAHCEYQQTLAQGYDGLGQAHCELNQYPLARAAHQKGISIVDRLVERHPDDPAIHRLAVGRFHLALAHDDLELKEAALRDVIERFTSLANRFANDRLFESTLARARDELGMILRSTGRMREAETEFRQAIGVHQRLSDLNDENPASRYQLAVTQSHLALLLKFSRRDDEAVAANRAAIELLNQLEAQHPYCHQFRGMLAQLQSDLGYLLASTGKPDDAIVAFREAVRLLERLTSESPEVPAHQSSLATNYGYLGTIELKLGNNEGARECFRASVSKWRSLSQQFPADPDYRMELATATVEDQRFAKGDERLKSLDDAVGMLHDLADRYPKRTVYTDRLIRALRRLALELSSANRLAEAEQRFLQAIDVAERFTRTFPEILRNEESAGEFALFGDLSHQLGKYEQAVGARRTAIENYRALARQYPDKPEYRAKLSTNLKRLGFALARLGEYDQARDSYSESIELAKQLVDQYPDELEYRGKMARRYELLGTLYLRLAQFHEAEQAFRAELAALQTIPDRSSPEPVSQLSLAQLHALLANILLEQTSPRWHDAQSAMLESIALCRNSDDLLTGAMLTCQLAEMLTQQGKFSDAQKLLAELLSEIKSVESRLPEEALQQGNVPLLFRWKIAEQLALAEAEEESRRLLTELDSIPLNSPARKNIAAWSIANWPGATSAQLAQANALVRAAIESNPDDASFWNTAGAVQYRLGDHAAAIRSLEKSLELNPRQICGSHLLLAMAKFQSGDREPARRDFELGNASLMFVNPFRIAEYRRMRDEAATLLKVILHDKSANESNNSTH